MVSAANVNTGKFNQSVEISVFAGSADLGSQNVFFFCFSLWKGVRCLYRMSFFVSAPLLSLPLFLVHFPTT